ncbi:MAG: biotin synthase, partial [Limnohabitans sp.]
KSWHCELLRGLQSKLSAPMNRGRLALTFEVIYGHAFKATAVTKHGASSVVSLGDMKKMLTASRKTL